MATDGNATGVSDSPTLTTPPSTRFGEAPAISASATMATADRFDVVREVALRRIPLTADVLGPPPAGDDGAFQGHRLKAATHFYLALDKAKAQIKSLGELLSVPVLPAHLLGTLLEPDGSPAAQVQVTLILGRKHYSTITKEQGTFVLDVPPGQAFPRESLTLLVHGADGEASVSVPMDQIAANGLLKDLTLPIRIKPLPVSIVASLEAMIPAGSPANGKPPAPAPVNQPVVTLGEGDGQITFRSDFTEDRFPYSIFFRLVEPRTSIVTSVNLFPVQDNGFVVLPIWSTMANPGVLTRRDYIDRTPVEQPISVDGFRDQIIGLNGGETVGKAEKVPMAGTLGLGYVLHLAQTWTPKGYSLGNLVYSLPLAPGEQERVAIFERSEVIGVRESEFLTTEEQQRFQELRDASTQATFTSGFQEAAKGGSHFETKADSSSWGVSFLIASGGGGSSSSSGDASSWLEGHRDTVQQAAEDTHAAVRREAAARRSALRTSMRLASASESASVTTKVVTNHNHTRALTLQYWEVQRLFEVSTGVEGATLVCLVPLEVVRFLPPGQPSTLTSDTQVDDRKEVLSRYDLVLKHADILARSLPRQYQYGLTLLTQFAADPKAKVEPAGGAAEDVIQFSLRGTFLPFEEIYVAAVTRRGTRLGPVRLSGTLGGAIPGPHDEYWGKSGPTRDGLLGYLRSWRQNTFGVLTGNLAIPPALARNDIVGFELSRRFQAYDYNLPNPIFSLLALVAGGTVPTAPVQPTDLLSPTAHFSPQELERELGGPILQDFSAAVLACDGSGNPTPNPHETYANDSLNRTELPAAAPLPVPAVQLAPVLRYSQVLEIEKMLQHVVRNTVTYSKAVWSSLTPEERAIMLEGFTIGVPPGGITDATQMIPLLNCVENRVLGYYGNSMILPFFLPPVLADGGHRASPITSRQVQEMLTAFHKTAFSPPQALIALPTRGVLAEAVLGSCPSAEKIDLTRFWNWADAPADTAPEIASVTLPTTQPSTVAGLTAPNSLTGLQPLINNFNAGTAAPAADTGLLQAMVKAASEQKGFSTELTGASLLAPLVKTTQETAEKARADALKTTKDLQAQAMATVGNILGGMKGNPSAGSDALRAVSGGGGESKADSKSEADKSKNDDKKTDDDSKKPKDNGDQDKSGGDTPKGGGSSGEPKGIPV